MEVHAFSSTDALAKAAAEAAAAAISGAIALHGHARITAATAASQVAFQRALIARRTVDWSKVELFQLDEFIGLPADHPALFRHQLSTYLLRPAGIEHVHLIETSSPDRARRELDAALRSAPLDVAVLGIGVNGHLAFNDPPADFETDAAYLEVTLDDGCRQQQVDDGVFTRVEDVPTRAVTMSISAMLSAREIIVVVPGAHKEAAVRAAIEGPVTPRVPASILQRHARVRVFRSKAFHHEGHEDTKKAF